MSLLPVLLWAIFRFSDVRFDAARVLLNLSAIPMAMGLLRYFSTVQSLGQLVLAVFAVCADMG